MIVINTTFHLPCPLRHEFIKWLKEHYVPKALESGTVTGPSILRVLGGSAEDPEGMNIACQLKAATLHEAHRWHDTEGAEIRRDMHERWGQKVLFFSTYLELVD